MAISDFNGDTFVAFLDISGFKEMMKGDGLQAVNALDKLNQAGFDVLQKHIEVGGIFISDCGVLFVQSDSLTKENKLKKILKVIQEINNILIQMDIMTTSSIAYGHFSYHNRIEFNGISKNPIYGNAYVSAFIDNENVTPKIEPGQCRIILNNNEDIGDYDILLLKKIKNHYYYYWMVENENHIEGFKSRYKDSYKLKYSGMLSAIKG